MERLNKNTWLSEGLEIIESDGFARITVDYLCERLQRSKGSFYFHFKNMDGYIEALMDFWLEENTLSIIREVDASKQIKSKKQLADKLALERPFRLGQVIRAWSYSNEIVRERLTKADEIRLEYLTKIEIQNGKSQYEAKDVAMLTYALLIGLQQLFPDMHKTEKLRLERLFSSKL